MSGGACLRQFIFLLLFSFTVCGSVFFPLRAWAVVSSVDTMHRKQTTQEGKMALDVLLDNCFQAARKQDWNTVMAHQKSLEKLNQAIFSMSHRNLQKEIEANIKKNYSKGVLRALVTQNMLSINLLLAEAEAFQNKPEVLESCATQAHKNYKVLVRCIKDIQPEFEDTLEPFFEELKKTLTKSQEEALALIANLKKKSLTAFSEI